ncbi:BirA family transcriptional regulator, biotin operon repressor / biotin-[acetyl-CoA-carboxylase] ligase [Methanolobus vulcani]|jgi:BirA family biotin operon repressor/biotin-[acetyl-CoA-carboxylase] ligase|uniref:BirA family transcriptional regulator, biotin operon repressor / biotin-[acetyl-CoA-carboxylase] ligase n=1 Tax=Methanolobus vulcani TaxID=38026 RepID=A0A7Z7AXF7_9EURY|nr:BirA family transcriptional regulator [Methanolobus sp.]MDK2947019.1 BirA family transcriptional regulator [Methanolobus sp.]SDF29123.1 BirA family transcriptional regulator, biotin operon repressor / biotin-[acetyl-CoA-carboxylase] ligase [Methanolobus vulcani]
MPVNDNKKSIISILRKSEGTPVSGQEIGEKLGITRAMVWKYIKALRKEGYDVRSSPKTGYILDSCPDKVDPEMLQNILKTSLIGNDVRYYSELESTNSTAREIAPSASEGTVVLAETQKNGRGRMGTEWQSVPGGLWLSLILKPSIPLENLSKVTLVAGIAVANTLRNMGVDAHIKWPNDVLVKGKKICGILTEVSAEIGKVDYVVLGIGINVNVKLPDLKDDIRRDSTSIANEIGKPIDRTSFLASLLYELEQQYIRFKTRQFAEIVDEWINLSDTIGRNVKVTTPIKLIEGKAVGITEKGALVVLDKNNKKHEIIAGNCRYSD